MDVKRLCKVILLLSVFCLGEAGVAGSPREKEWAFLIFLNGHNNLSEYGDLNLNQLEKVGSTEDIDIVVQWAKLGTANTYRLRVEKDNDFNKVTSPFVQTMPRQDMGDYKNLVEFVRWSAEKYPAKHYFVSFWNHGSGWHRNSKKPMRGVSYDDYSGNHITTEQMGIAMREITAIIGHKVEIVGADACLMAMAEVGSEMADGADYFVASEETEPGLGWPYDTFFQRWADKPTASSAEITRYLVEEYHKYLSPTEQITLSSFNLGELPRLWAAMRTLGNTIKTLPTPQLMALRNATRPALAFYYTDYVDLGDWVKRALAVTSSGIDASLLTSIRDIVRGMVPANMTSDKYKDAEGIAFWAPSSRSVYDQHAAMFQKLRYTKETGWDEVIRSLLSIPACVQHPQGQWATEVISFSTQYSDSGWSAKEVLGACNTESYGDAKTAWAPAAIDGTDEYLSLAFAQPVYSTGAIVRETSGNGFVTQIEAIEPNGTSHIVWSGDDGSALGATVDFETTWAKTPYLVNGLKVSITTKKNPGVWKEVDSIQLIGTL